jgi:hypothetical protein
VKHEIHLWTNTSGHGDIDAQQNEKLFTYFKDRQIWLVEPDEREREARQLKLFSRTVARPTP